MTHALTKTLNVFGKYIARCTCGWQTRTLDTRHKALEHLADHADYLNKLPDPDYSRDHVQ